MGTPFSSNCPKAGDNGVPVISMLQYLESELRLSCVMQVLDTVISYRALRQKKQNKNT